MVSGLTPHDPHGAEWRQHEVRSEGTRPARTGAGRAEPFNSTWILYAVRVYWIGCLNLEASMLDLIFLAVGLGFFALMALYARWAAGA